MTSHHPPRATLHGRAHGADPVADDAADPRAAPPVERPFDEAPDEALERLLDGPLLQVPDGFDARVLAALPASDAAIACTAAGTSPASAVAPDAARPRAARAWRLVQALLLAACGAAGAVEVLLFVGGLWTATAVAVG